MCKEIILNAAPTLAGLKTANLFTVEYYDRNGLLKDIRDVNMILSTSGILAIPMRFSERRVLMYVYRLNALKKDFGDPVRSEILKHLGYNDQSIGKMISELRRRLSSNNEFPHEIGLFLGYPTEDVIGFINNNGHDYKFIGTWKVYGDEAFARTKFKSFDKCTRSYAEQYRKGIAFSKLIVA